MRRALVASIFCNKPVRADVLFARLQRYTRVASSSPIENGVALPPLTSIGPGDGVRLAAHS